MRYNEIGHYSVGCEHDAHESLSRREAVARSDSVHLNRVLTGLSPEDGQGIDQLDSENLLHGSEESDSRHNKPNH